MQYRLDRGSHSVYGHRSHKYEKAVKCVEDAEKDD